MPGVRVLPSSSMLHCIDSGCSRWRFTVLEIQAVLVELLENFQFALPAVVNNLLFHSILVSKGNLSSNTDVFKE